MNGSVRRPAPKAAPPTLPARADNPQADYITSALWSIALGVCVDAGEVARLRRLDQLARETARARAGQPIKRDHVGADRVVEAFVAPRQPVPGAPRAGAAPTPGATVAWALGRIRELSDRIGLAQRGLLGAVMAGAVVLFGLAAPPTPALGHDWIPIEAQWCCDKRDCKPAQRADLKRTGDGWLIVETGQMFVDGQRGIYLNFAPHLAEAFICWLPDDPENPGAARRARCIMIDPEGS